MKFRLIVLLIVTSLSGMATPLDSIKTVKAVRTTQAPKIDGKIESLWYQAPLINGFIQTKPYFNQKPLYDTDVRILYDDKAIYIAAFLKDAHPDSILHQLGNRDDEDLNADYFIVGFDTYNKQQDAFIFGVSASGVQMDQRTSDGSYNAVWESKVLIVDSGWVVEMKIPYSAIRFPQQDKQTWRLQCVRTIRRIRQESRLFPEPREADNPLLYWAHLEGIENMNAPLRLSCTPYLTSGLQIESQKGTKTETSTLFNGGMDLKYGINESYTLDATLLPDFSQVQSDNKYKNLSAYETVYDEQRPFFKESVDLFSKGNIFYSRRIGRTPRNFYDVENSIDSTEQIKKNPQQTQLINALKISGRNSHGLAIGVLNAITANTYATLENESGGTRKLLTEPWANYNVFVLDQAIKGGNDFFITNTNFLRDKTCSNSDVTASGLTLVDKTNTWQLALSGGMSNFYFNQKPSDSLKATIPKTGYKSSLNFNKINGSFKFGLSSSFMNENFNANDVGLTLYNNYIKNYFYINYQQNKPAKLLLNYGANIDYYQSNHLTSTHISNARIEMSAWGTTYHYTSFWFGGYTDTYNGYDYYEPRQDGYFFRTGRNLNTRFGFSTDYRNPFALDFAINLLHNIEYKTNDYNVEISPVVRLSNHISFRYTLGSYINKNEFGFADIDSYSLQPIFGKRNLTTITNTISGKYLFKNDLSLSLNFRYYWSQGIYDDTYYLNPDGYVSNSMSNSFAPNNYNFNYNSLYVDLIFSWQFAPGSNIMLIWKNEIFYDGTQTSSSYFSNLKNLSDYPQTNTLLLKVLYYLDYEYLFKKKHKFA